MSNSTENNKLTDYEKLEYTSLRTELIHHDRVCFNIISLLLGASTAIYGLVVKENLFPLLIILSVIWFVGFLYIVEKRANIRRISFYIEQKFEKDEENNKDYWERWTRQDRHPEQKPKANGSKTTPGTETTSGTNKKKNIQLQLPTVSPLRWIEFPLLIITNFVNIIWLSLVYEKSSLIMSNQQMKNFAQWIISDSSFCGFKPVSIIVLFLLIIMLVISCYLTFKYYSSKDEAYKELDSTPN